MIIYHQSNVAAFAGNYTFYWMGQPLLQSRISVTTAAPAFKSAWAFRVNNLIGGGVDV